MVSPTRLWTPQTPNQVDHMTPMRGEVTCELVDARTGRVDQIVKSNMITTAHRGLVASWLAGQDPVPPDYIALGTGAETLYAETNRDAAIDLKSTGADQRLGQGFQLGTARSVNAVLVWLLRIGTSAGNLWLDIYSDSGGLPNALIASSDPIPINGLSTTYDWGRFVFPTPPALGAGVQYHWVLRSTGYTYSSGVTEVNLGVDQSSPGYASGAVSTYNGTTWSLFGTASDACFRVTAEPAASFTTIINETTRKQLTSKSLHESTATRLLTNFITSEANGRHGMVGLLNAASNGVLSAVAAIDLIKLNTQNLNIYWVIHVN